MGLFNEVTDNFLDLDDTPTTYSGSIRKYARVSDACNCIEFKPALAGVTSSGIAPPDPGETTFWYNTEDRVLYTWDPSRGDWLSNNIHNYLFTYQGACSGLYLSIGTVGHEDVYYYIPRAATITAIIMASEQKGEPAKSFDIKDGATTVTSFTGSGFKYQDMLADYDLDSGAELKIFCTAAGQACRNPVIILEIRWRYTP